ncbi:diaminopropionate ammonia-lyase [Promicromonospora umidemergens]|uniref:Diaminopropionate ammonia-lyase n=1 Tax=Promicromonospora umidemergens TaxID=629679 RepID=A0ABP8XEI1_9MICO|nr:diaminopropionate ammonia-lyase [Promicromonospora umidemergens]MCP2283037.1 diaminopropionate ammonia-lyase [Promicromonospora umidemergens]
MPAIDFHRTLPGYQRTPLRDLPGLAAELGVGRVLVKEESSRLGLPAFKVLGASYATARAVGERFGLTSITLDAVRGAVRDRGVRLYAATDGNHGRAVAHMAALIGAAATIYYPQSITEAAKRAIATEGAQSVEVDGAYDDVVARAAAEATADPASILVQDTSWPGYTDIPQWMVDGYSTLCLETDVQLSALGLAAPDLVVVPVGVGSLAQAVVSHYRGAGTDGGTLLAVEPDRAAGLVASLRAGEPVTTPTGDTIMTGLSCGTVSALAWPVLRDGLDGAVTVSDDQAATAVDDLARLGVDSGPCGAATLAAARLVLGQAGWREAIGLRPDAVVLLLSTEGRAANPVPEDRV